MAMSDEAKYSGRKKKKRNEKKSFSDTFIPKKTDSSSELTGKLITLVSLIVLIVCLVILGKSLFETLEAKQNHKKIKEIAADNRPLAAVTLPPVPENVGAAENDPDAPRETEAVQRIPLELLPLAKALLEDNPDTVGYISIPGCVDEPVVQYSDNEYYLDHNFYGNQRQCGTCFADYRANLDPYERSDVITLYAHNQKDGTMFGNLDYYRWDPAYWLKNPFVYFDTNYTNDTYVIFSSFVVNVLPEHDNGQVFDYQNYIDFDDTYSYETFISEVTKRSQIITGVECSENDDYLILSTCSTEWDESRHVLVARRLRSDEDTETFDITNFKPNPNPKWPAIYYKYHGGAYIEEE